MLKKCSFFSQFYNQNIYIYINTINKKCINIKKKNIFQKEKIGLYNITDFIEKKQNKEIYFQNRIYTLKPLSEFFAISG